MIKRQWLMINHKMRLRPEILFFFFIGTWNLSCSIQWKTITKTMVASMTAESFLIALIHVTPLKSRVKQTLFVLIFFIIFLFYVNMHLHFEFSKIFQKQPIKGVLRKKCSENMQQICYFNKIALQLYWNCTSAWVISCKFGAYFQSTFS